MKKMFVAMMLAAVLGGCATTGKLTSAERLDLYRAHAGEPVKSFRYFGSLNGWTELGDSALAVWTKPNEAWLLNLSGPCMDLSFAPAISITNMMGQVSARFDRVIVHGSSPMAHVPCRIDSIQPLDVKTLRASEKQLREAKISERAAEQGTETE